MPKIDFHCHTKYSKCSNLEPKHILKICLKKNIQGVMICDHNTVKGVKAFKEIIMEEKKNRIDFIFIPGIEILTNKGEILGAFIEEMPSSSNFPDVAEEIREMGGMVVVPHPYDKIRRKAFKLDNTYLEMIDAIEVYNSRCIIPWANKKALEFAEKYSKLKTAGSDAHFAIEVGNAGLIFDGTTREEFQKQLMSGKTTYWGNQSSLITHFHTIIHRLRRILRENP